MSATLLVDGNAVSYTIKLDECTSEQDFAKKYLNRLRDYAKQLSSMVKVVIFFDDKSGGTWRDKIYPEYQQNRVLAKEKYTEQQKAEIAKRTYYLNYLKSQIDNSKFKYISYPHTEADDLITLYIKYVQQEGEICTILTTDKDLYQLICQTGKKKVQIMSLVKHTIVKDEKEGKKILERKVMLGDPSDNIPSVCKGVGEGYYPDFRVFIKTMKDTETDPTNKEEASKVCESLGIKYIGSFSNYSQEQLRINKMLVDLNTVYQNDEKEQFTKSKYIQQLCENGARFSPFSLYNIRFTDNSDTKHYDVRNDLLNG